MGFKIVYSHLANLDVVQTIEYYESTAGEKVAKSFFEEIINAENTLKKSPKFEIIYKDFHRLPLKKFPYILIYKISEETKTIKVYRVFHTSQNPEKYPE